MSSAAPKRPFDKVAEDEDSMRERSRSKSRSRDYNIFEAHGELVCTPGCCATVIAALSSGDAAAAGPEQRTVLHCAAPSTEPQPRGVPAAAPVALVKAGAVTLLQLVVLRKDGLCLALKEQTENRYHIVAKLSGTTQVLEQKDMDAAAVAARLPSKLRTAACLLSGCKVVHGIRLETESCKGAGK